MCTYTYTQIYKNTKMIFDGIWDHSQKQKQNNLKYLEEKLKIL